MLSKMIGKMPEGMMANIRMDSLGQARNKKGYTATDARLSLCVIRKSNNRGKSKWQSCYSIDEKAATHDNRLGYQWQLPFPLSGNPAY